MKGFINCCILNKICLKLDHENGLGQKVFLGNFSG